jgi:hypothetical protein
MEACHRRKQAIQFSRSPGRVLGNGFKEKIDYTPLNAEDKVQLALEAHMQRVVSNIKN